MRCFTKGMMTRHIDLLDHADRTLHLCSQKAFA